MPPTCGQTRRPQELYYTLVLNYGFKCVEQVGDYDVMLSGVTESPVKYHSFIVMVLTSMLYLEHGETVLGWQFKWGAFLLKSSGGV